VTTVAGAKSALNRSPTLNFTRFVTFASRAFLLASAIRSGLRSMPTPRAPCSFAAVMTMRPSPQPRSYSVSFFETPAISSILCTVGILVGT
jgi:hypothetical protein